MRAVFLSQYSYTAQYNLILLVLATEHHIKNTALFFSSLKLLDWISVPSTITVNKVSFAAESLVTTKENKDSQAMLIYKVCVFCWK